MNIFKKLFGISSEEGTTNYNKNESEDAVDKIVTSTEVDVQTPQQSFDPDMTSWENFFGINLKQSPNEGWDETSPEYNGENLIRNFENYQIINSYFSYVKAKVIGTKATNFFFKCTYSWDTAFDVYFLIERDMIHHGNYTNIAAAEKFRGNFDSFYDRFDWDIEGCHITLSRDIESGDIELSIWTLFYNEEYLGTTEITTGQVASSETLPKTFDDSISWDNFFGVNLKTSPNELWEEGECGYNAYNKYRNFACYHINNAYFSYADAKVIGDSATNFFFKCPYSWNVAFDIYFLIERDLVHHGNYNYVDALKNCSYNFDELIVHVEWTINGCDIRMSRDRDTGEIELGIWTSFYNSEYLNQPNETTPQPYEEESSIVGDSEEEPSMPQKTIHVHFPDSIETLRFVHDYLDGSLIGNAQTYVIRADYNIIHVYDQDTYDEVYSFENSEIATFLSGKLGAIGFYNFNCDNINDIQAEVLVILADSSEKEENNVLVHFEMSYLVDPIEMDYRGKTIMDGKMNLSLVGIQYRDNYEELKNTLKEGMAVVLKPEPTNEYDPNALAFYLNEQIIGYLPKKDQPFAQIFMAKGHIDANICEIDDKWIDTEVTITKDMIDFNAYEKSDVSFTKIESIKGGGRKRQSINLRDFVELSKLE